MTNSGPAGVFRQLRGRIIRTVVVAIIAVFIALGDHWSTMSEMWTSESPDQSTVKMAALMGIYVAVLLVMILVAFKPQAAPASFSPAVRGLIVAWDVVALWIAPIVISLVDIGYMAVFFFMGAVASTHHYAPIGYVNVGICICGSVPLIQALALRGVFASAGILQKIQSARDRMARNSSGPDSV